MTNAKKTGKRGKKGKKAKRTNPALDLFRGWPSAADTGFPADATIEEQDAHRLRYGRTPILHREIADIIRARGLVGAFVAALERLERTTPNEASFFEALDALLAWQPQAEKGPGFEVDHAAAAGNTAGGSRVASSR